MQVFVSWTCQCWSAWRINVGLFKVLKNPRRRCHSGVSQVSFAEYSLFYRALLQKRPIILRSLTKRSHPTYELDEGVIRIEEKEPKAKVSFQIVAFTHLVHLPHVWTFAKEPYKRDYIPHVWIFAKEPYKRDYIPHVWTFAKEPYKRDYIPHVWTFALLSHI